MTNFREDKRWSSSSVRSMCIKRDRYTRGDCAAYEKMLDFVSNNEPTLENIEKVAADIVEHSDLSSYGMSFEENVEAIMFDLANDAITYSFARI
jgi:hypothetical protein